MYLVSDSEFGNPGKMAMNETPSNMGPDENNTNQNDHALIDPSAEFYGTKLLNSRNYICFLNSVVNGFLSLKTCRQMIPFMEDSIQELMKKILNGDLNDLEQLRIQLHQFSIRRQDGTRFPIEVHSDPIEALTKLIEFINMEALYQNCFVGFNLHETCNQCQKESNTTIDNPWGNPNILYLELNGCHTVQEAIDEYIKNSKSEKIETLYCRQCQEYQNHHITKSIVINNIVIIGIIRFKDNGEKINDEIIPDYYISIGKSKRKLKSLIAHHGDLSDGGHYKFSSLNESGTWNLFDDFLQTESHEDYTKPYMIFYEKVEINSDQSERARNQSQFDTLNVNSDPGNDPEVNKNPNISDSTEDLICVSCLKRCETVSSLKQHIDRNKKSNCKSKYVEENLYEDLKKKCQLFSKNKKILSDERKKKQKIEQYHGNPDTRKKKLEQSKQYYSDPEKRKKKLEQKSNRYHKFQDLLTKDDDLLRKTFLDKQRDGLSYICISCHKIWFQNGVRVATEKLIEKLRKEGHDKYVSLKERFKYNNHHWVCHNCHKDLQKGKMPYTCHFNGLENSEIPQVFKEATMLEKLMTKIRLPFIKVRELPSSRMACFNNKVVNVKINDSDVLKTAMCLPRSANELGTINVAMKRRLSDRSRYRDPEVIRPKVVNEILKILEDRHVAYKNFPIQYLDPSSQYKFIRLPLMDKTTEKSLVESDVIKLVPPILDELGFKMSNQTPINENCFIYALLDQFR